MMTDTIWAGPSDSLPWVYRPRRVRARVSPAARTGPVPATPVQAVAGHAVRALVPRPTPVIPSVACEDSKAILAILGEYDVFVGGNRGIEYSDEAKFIEDQRALKQVAYAFGRAYDNTSATLLDISKLEDAVVPVKVKGTVSTKASA